ncbi:hypothetical protein ROA7450_01600 [Roseovarius albus]|uniref:Uncharacterized protein n=1 Tax=Roseovarius albus TaxID=1247867 RepID=A0A1X6YY49_9RHOB|nr:hypothetical protein [Roseovarius albus]SLN34752.1 hypothetical protein ROA7450_01600 [Roseovarius albus]
MKDSFPERPKIEIADKPNDHESLGRSVPHAIRSSSPVISMAHKFATMADKHYMSADHCLLYLARRVGYVRQYRERSQNFFGRLINKIMGDDPEVVPLSGAVVAGVLTFLGDPLPKTFDRGQDYNLRFDIADKLLSRMLEKAEVEGMLK